MVIGVKDITKVGMVKEGRGTRYLLRTCSKSVYTKLISITRLTDGSDVEVIPHPTLNKVQGVVYEADSTDVDEKTLLQHLESQGVQSVRRITKRINKSDCNTPLIILSFHGTILPEFVYFGRLRVPVRTYYPAPTVCFNCGTYGHPRKFCQQASICLQCSQEHRVAEGEQLNNVPYCMHCKGSHSLIARTCPKFKEEQNVIRIRVNLNISTAEARKIYASESQKETIASEVQKRLSQAETAKDKIIAELRAEVELLKQQLTTLANQDHAGDRNSQQPEKQSRTTLAAPLTSNSKQSTQRMSRKDKTPNSPPSTRSNNCNAVGYMAEEITRTRSRSRKHLMEISPTDLNHHPGKRATRRTDTGGTSG